MTNEANKTEIVQFRLTPDQLELLDRSFKHYMSHTKEVITRAEYIRQVVMIACLKETGMLALGKEVAHE